MALNLGAPDRLAFDAATRHPSLPLAVLCDGANGTPHGGAVAQAASQRVLEALEAALVGCRLLADYWAEGEGEAWRSALARCATPAQLAVYVHVLRAAAGEEVAAGRLRRSVGF